MKTLIPYSRLLYTFTAHITTPAPAWHENPVLVLARDLQLMELENTITENGYIIRKSWSHTRGTEFKVCNSAGRHVKAFKCAKAAAGYVYAGEQEAS